MMGKLVVVGTGIKSIAHVSIEAQFIIQNADKVLYLVNEPLLKEWLERESKISESLEPIYFAQEKRVDNYAAITHYIVSESSKYDTLCVVLYGHPIIFSMPALAAVKEINDHGGDAVILPAISSLDCLYADLEFDPGDEGCFSAEATDFLIYERKFDPRSHLILLQVGNIGRHDQVLTSRVSVLKEYLLQFYQAEHLVCYYEAAQYPLSKSRKDYFPLSEIEKQPVSSLTTLYVPPMSLATYNIDMINKLGIDPNNFIATEDVK